MPEPSKAYKDPTPVYQRYLLELSARTQRTMFRAKRLRKSEHHDLNDFHQASEEFQNWLEELYFAYEPKFAHQEKVERPEFMEDKEVVDLSFEESQKLMQKIRTLQERLGHTQFEGKLHEEEGFGVSAET